ncbi:hypothetical protein quinque_002406 [Culex quinquefasciatus]
MDNEFHYNQTLQFSDKESEPNPPKEVPVKQDSKQQLQRERQARSYNPELPGTRDGYGSRIDSSDNHQLQVPSEHRWMDQARRRSPSCGELGGTAAVYRTGCDR